MKRIIVILSLLGLVYSGMAQSVSRVEPRSWFVGMSTPLQLMFYGSDLTGASVSVNGSGVSVAKVHSADSPNYLFVDVKVAPNAKAGTYVFTIKKDGKTVDVPYNFDARSKNSAHRQGFTSKDVIYLLMPDRFAKGVLPDGLPCVEGRVDRSDYNARHGGNLQGMIDNLDYIADLGATAIWSTPLTVDSEGEGSYHGYAASDYYTLDPRLGTNDMYKTYVEKAHSKGLKIVQDLVPNHCGAAHWWMADLPFGDWVNYGNNYVQTRYAQHAQMDPHASQIDFVNNRDGWFVESMPDMNLRNPYVLNYLTQMAVWWAEWAGVDGFRVDTYPYNDKHAASEWIARIVKEYPNINIVGECWLNEPAMVAYFEGEGKNRDGYSSALPSVMDFPLQQRLNTALTQPKAEWGQGAQLLYFVLAQDYLYANPGKNLLIFAENHDTDRLAHFADGRADKQMLAYSLLATMRGIPQIYYGSEQMMRGDQKGGHGGQRVDFVGGWSGDERNLFTGVGRSAREDSIYQHTRKLFNWRKTSDAVHNGRLVHFFPDIKDNMYVYGRVTDKELVFVVLNFSDEPQKFDWSRYAELFENGKSGVDIVSGGEVTYGDEVTLAPYQSMVVEIKK